MKKFVALAALILMITCMAIGCGAGRVFAYSDPSEMIETDTNREFIIQIALASNPSTGYTWVATFDETKLELVSDTYEADKTDVLVVGAGGTQYLQFKALQSGEVTITMDYQRPWEKQSIDQKVFIVNID
ncbi:MAG: protease inhibitor I42 family protein [Dehalococcoidales bacterium]|nr:protease inhibitor I42 family protein [Dehalococcoidales bacterium]